MAYIRYGTLLPSGKMSGSYVIGDPAGLMSFNEACNPIPYGELVELFKAKTYLQIKQIVRERLILSDEETEIVCDVLFAEYKAGEWDAVPEWSEGKKRLNQD